MKLMPFKIIFAALPANPKNRPNTRNVIGKICFIIICNGSKFDASEKLLIL